MGHIAHLSNSCEFFYDPFLIFSYKTVKSFEMRIGIYINYAYQEASIAITQITELYISKWIKDVSLPSLMLHYAPFSCPIYGLCVMASIKNKIG